MKNEILALIYCSRNTYQTVRRAAFQLEAAYRKGHSTTQVEDVFWAAADSYKLLIDKERGILLRYDAVHDGETYASAYVEGVTFNESIPDSIFTLATDES
ncbi:MAG: hypothetical protein OHK0046_29510 [Anaerolineae bacterium]